MAAPSNAFAAEFWMQDVDPAKYHIESDLTDWFRERRRQIVNITRGIRAGQCAGLDDHGVMTLWLTRMSGKPDFYA